jgi:recombination protein RecA
VRLDIRPSSAIKNGDETIGRLTTVKVVKNKVAPPFKKCEFDIMFGEGISRSGEILDFACNYDIIQKSGSWFSYDGSKLAQGRDAAKAVIADNPELAEELEAKIMEAVKSNPGKSLSTRAPKFKRPGAAEAKPEEPAEAPADDETDELDDEFSIEEDV